MDAYENIRQGERGAWISIGAYIVLSALKLTCGWLFASEALTADGINNATDIVASVAVLIGLRISRKPPDRDHPYGHLRAETIAALLAAFIMATAGLQVLIAAVRKLWHGDLVAPDAPAGWLALGAAAIMYVVYRFNIRLAKRIHNQALLAVAQDNRSDALVSVGAAIGIGGAYLGMPWLDTVAALAVGVLIIKTAWGILFQSIHALTDGFDAERLMSLRKTIAETEGVRSIKEIRARLHGSAVLIDVVIAVDGALSLEESHHICDLIERRTAKHHPYTQVHVHVEPDGSSSS